ncbi:MAG: P-II family nitrogen regulator [bacterium]|nr:P-II family nitrogen regulator [bacterium]
MKQIIAVVRPYLAERVLENLRFAPLEALSVQEVKGFGRQKSYLENYGDSEYSLAFLPKVEITMWVEDLRVEEVVKRVTDVARSGRMGDGKVMILPTERLAEDRSQRVD